LVARRSDELRRPPLLGEVVRRDYRARGTGGPAGASDGPSAYFDPFSLAGVSGAGKGVYAPRMSVPRPHQRARRPRGDRGGRAKAVASALLRAATGGDGYGTEHALAVADLSRPVGIELGLDDEALETLESAALLHDVGKAGMHEEILRKAAPLTRGESKIVEAHPKRGARMVEPWACLRGEAARAIEYHHERYDGGGYPEGLAGERIPLGARIVAAADAYDAMVRGRPYAEAIPPTEAVGRLFAGAGGSSTRGWWQRFRGW
jgi:putative nucleotidyltransferase with HDIG domain